MPSINNLIKDIRTPSGVGRASRSLFPILLFAALITTVPAVSELQVISAYACESEHVGCHVPGNLCLLMRNYGDTTIRMADFGSAQVVYELPEAPELGERQIMSKHIGGMFSASGSDHCCKFSEIAANGKCGDQKSVASRETFIVGFTGTFKDANGNSREMRYTDANEQRLIISMILPNGFKLSHQMVDGSYELDTPPPDQPQGTSLEVTALYPRVDSSKHPFCNPDGLGNRCELSKSNVNGARIIIEVKNSGAVPIEPDDFDGIKMYINDVPLQAGKEWLFPLHPFSWLGGSARDLYLDRTCGDIALMAGGRMEIRVDPPLGIGTTAEISCLKCCNMQPSFQSECALTCESKEVDLTPPRNDVCGDGVCYLLSECSSGCTTDCSPDGCRGNMLCDVLMDETCRSSPSDCPCGPGELCNPDNPASNTRGCTEDRCGDHVCSENETTETCCTDCGCPAPKLCKKGVCEVSTPEPTPAPTKAPAVTPTPTPTPAQPPSMDVIRNEITQNLGIDPKVDSLTSMGYAPSGEVQVKEGGTEGVYIYEAYYKKGVTVVIVEGKYSAGAKKIVVKDIMVPIIDRITADPIGFAKDNIEIAGAVIGALGVLAAYLHIVKRKTLGEEKVKVKRGVTREGNIIKIGVKVQNNSTFPLVDVGVELDIPKAFRIEGGSKFIDLGTIKQDEFQSAIFKLVPTRCVSGNITGSVTYHDVKNQRKSVEIEPVTVGSVCPFLEKVAMTADAFNEKVKGLPVDEKRIRSQLDPRSMYARLQSKCSAMHAVYEGYSPDGKHYLCMYSSRGAYSKNFIGMYMDFDVQSNEVLIRVYGEQEEMITGLLGEIVEIVEDTAGMSVPQ